MEVEHGVALAAAGEAEGGVRTVFNLSELLCFSHEVLLPEQLQVAVETTFYLSLVLVFCFLELLLQRLLRETLLEGVADDLGDVVDILADDDAALGQEVEQGDALRGLALQFGNYLNGVATVLRELILNLEGAQSIDLITKEIDTIG